ncbi:MAG: putative membrane protein YecN with MAPEG domain [Oceanicoccus sp.]|jgi:uncharacterized membrane protein YecN with MAPEG domain
MDLVAAVIGLIVLEYFVFVMIVGAVRGKVGIQAPAMTGDPRLERALRVQTNTLEQMVIVIPSLWLYAQYNNQTVAAGLGLAFLVGRLLYAVGYMKDPNKRAVGFIIGFLASITLLLGGLYGALMAAL